MHSSLPEFVPPPLLRTGDVHVRVVGCGHGSDGLAALRALLSGDERRRADAFGFEADRVRFTTARGLLRLTLGTLLGESPAAIRFRVAPHGKLALETAGGGAHPLRFNVSHAGDLALIALAWEREVGVDVEKVRARPTLDRIAKRYFASGENAVLAALPEPERTAAFFRCWTLKEAYLKARGEGLSRSMAGFEVTPLLRSVDDPPTDEALLRIAGTDEDRVWTLRRLPAPAGYVAALAAEGGGWKMVVEGGPAGTKSGMPDHRTG